MASQCGWSGIPKEGSLWRPQEANSGTLDRLRTVKDSQMKDGQLLLLKFEFHTEFCLSHEQGVLSGR